MYKEELKNYLENGFCRVKSVFTSEEIAEFTKEVNKFIENESSKLKGREINFSDGKVNSIHALAANGESYFAKLLNSKKMKDFASQFLEDEAVAKGAELFAKPAKVGLPSPWHQDNAYWCVDNHNALTIWIALDHCDENNGCVTYFSGSHRLGLLPHKPSFAPGSSQTILDEELLAKNEKNRVCLTLEPGDVLVHHSLTIHGSTANKSDRSRRGVTLQYIGAKSRYDQKMKAGYEAMLSEQIRLRQSNKT